MKARCYLVLKSRRNREGVVSAISIQRVTKRPPDLKSDEAVIQLQIEVDPSLFDAQVLAVSLDAPKEIPATAKARRVK